MTYYGQHKDPQVDEYLHKTFFQDQTSGFFIECGAHDGLYDSSCRFFEELGWQGFNIEADPGLFKLLSRNRPKSTNINVGLTSQKDSRTKLEFTATMSQGRNPGHGSFTIPEDRLEGLKVHNKISKIQVDAISLKDLLSDRKVNSVDLLVLDVEGHEAQVLEGMEGGTLPKVLCVEFPITGLEVVKDKCFKLGYSFHSCVHNNAHFVLEVK